jgi:hypothetical protein
MTMALRALQVGVFVLLVGLGVLLGVWYDAGQRAEQRCTEFRDGVRGMDCD